MSNGAWDCFSDQKDLQTAKSHFQKLTDVCPDYPEGFYNLGTTYRQLERCQEAAASYARAIALKPNYLEAKRELSEASQCMALQDGAVKVYAEMIGKNPSDPQPHFELGRLFEERGDLERAATEYETAIKLNPKWGRAWYHLSKVYDRLLRSADLLLSCRNFLDVVDSRDMPDERGWCLSRIDALR